MSNAIVFSGVQPTGNLTIGNYLGAIKNWSKLQDEHDCIFSVVDMHALTLSKDPEALRESCLNTLAFYIAAGIDPEKSIIFIQSSVKEHSELAWIFQCLTPIGWLNRMTQFKDKAGKNKEKACVGLYTYPVLMAADILLYNATLVPVGDDQAQHIEIATDIGLAFNRKYDVDYFQPPKPMLSEKATRVMSLRDGRKKMSKSDESDASRINLSDSDDLIAKKIRKAKTDSIDDIYYDKENRPEISNMLAIYGAIYNISVKEAEKKCSDLSMKQFKEVLAEAVIDSVGIIRDRANILIKDKAYLFDIANLGTQQATELATHRMAQIRRIIGFAGNIL